MSGCYIAARRIIPGRDSIGAHRGMNASLAVHARGYRAWGYGDSKLSADKQAVTRTLELLDADLCAKISQQPIFSDGAFEFGNEIERFDEDTFAVCWVWVPDDESGVKADDEASQEEIDTKYRNAAFAPLGEVEGTVSIGDDPGAYVKILVNVNELDLDKADDDE